jgi:hypothetical protein
MLWTPQFGDVKTISNYGIVGAASPGTALPEGGTANTYGTVTEIISAANNVFDSFGIEIDIVETAASGVASQASVDILIGGATDDVLISSLLVGWVYAATVRSYFFPVHIPAGVRIAARLSTPRTAITDPRICITLHGGSAPPWRVGHKVVTYGTKIDNSRGQAVTPTASGGTASVTQMTSSSSMDHFYFLPGFQMATGTALTLKNYNVGIGVGASTEERIGTWWWRGDTGEKSAFHPSMGAWRNVPAGTRLSLLVSNSGTNDTAYDGHIYAVG